ncbi:MAG: DUF255 domain-containing protein [Planctomycetota bacterium]
MNGIEWRSFDPSSFEEARTKDHPVLLFLTAAWCRWCREMETQTFADPGVVELVTEHFIPIKVDKDRRPDIDERFNMGGWPSTVFLTPSGEVITGGTYFETEDFREVLRRVAAYYREEKDQIAVAVERLVEQEQERQRNRELKRGKLSESIVAHVITSIVEGCDSEYGGFGSGQKFPHPEAIDFALLEFAKTQDPSLKRVIDSTLTAIVQGDLHDAEQGGFYRYCGTRDWREPNTEKLLETNAGLLRNFLEAWQLLGKEEFRSAAEGIVRYLLTTLRDPETGGFAGSQDADDAYYSLRAEERRERTPPQVDRTIYTNWTAHAASSLFKAGAVLVRPDLTAAATGAIEFLLHHCYAEGRGMYHYWDGSRHILGLLTDQIYMARALVHAVQYTGETDYLPVLDDLLGSIVRKQSATHGGFYDISEDHASFGSLRRRNKSILENALMAEVLIRAYYLSLDDNRLTLARRTLEAFAQDYHLFGYLSASYARAVDLFFHKPMHIVIVGKKGDQTRDQMVHAAAATFVPSKIVLALDPERDADLLRRLSFPAHDETTAYVCLERVCSAEVHDASMLPRAMTKAEKDRSK